MAFIPINTVGQPGVVMDIEPHLLSPAAWSYGQNVRMNDGSVHKFLGHQAVFDPPSVAPYQLYYVPGASSNFWVYAGLAKVYTYTGGTHYDITRSVGGDYSADADLGWNGGVLSGIPILNNGVDVPQMWNPVGTGQPLQDLTNWPASTTVRILRPFGNFMVGLDWTESGTRYPYKVRWSHPADPGAVPSSWDVSDATKDAGETDLGETPDFLIDCLPLRNINIVYKQQSAYTMQFVGGTFVFNLLAITKLDGIFAQDCAVEFRPGNHAVLTPDDFIVHNAVTAESVIDGINRDWLFKSIDPASYARTFLLHNRQFNEVWICFPEVGATFCTHALVWNYREKTYGHRDLPDVVAVAGGVVPQLVSTDTWDSGAAVTWDSSEGIERWDQTEASPIEYRTLMASPGNTKLYLIDSSYQFDSAAFQSIVERTSLPVSGLNRKGSATLNFESIKVIRGVRPRFKINPGTSMRLWVGTQQALNDTITWSGPYSIDPANEYKVDVALSGRLLSFRIEDNSAAVAWELDGYDLDLDTVSLW